MEHRKLGNTGINVTTLCYGCAAAYARDLISDEEAVKLFYTAYNYGINFFDTGHSYGKAEERIGLALRKHPEISRESIVISTKFGTRIDENNKLYHCVEPKWIEESVQLSLKRMNIDYIDLLYIHGGRIEDLQREDVLNTLKDLKKRGIIRSYGVNTFDLKTMQYIADTKCVEAVMLDYNIIKQDREPVIEQLYKNGIGVVAGQAIGESVFLKNLWNIKSKKDIWYILRTFGRKSSRKLFFNGRKYSFLNNIDDYDGSQIALKYVIDNKYVSSAGFGTCDYNHLKKDVEALNITIPEEIITKIKTI